MCVCVFAWLQSKVHVNDVCRKELMGVKDSIQINQDSFDNFNFQEMPQRDSSLWNLGFKFTLVPKKCCHLKNRNISPLGLPSF